MADDALEKFKEFQRQAWATFAPMEVITTQPAARLVRVAQLRPGERVLDVACGTGVVAVTAAVAGAQVQALDLSPVLLERARENAALAGVDIRFTEGDVEQLPYQDASFDVVLSQFGHMFAPRPALALSEMLRVLRPGGRIAFSTWPPELYVGRLFALIAAYAPPPPAGVSPPPQWGDPNVVRERLGSSVAELMFERDLMFTPALSPTHHARRLEASIGPLTKLVAALEHEPERLRKLRAELDALTALFFEANTVRQQYLITRAVKR